MIRKKDFMCICSDEAREKSEACFNRVIKELGHEDGWLTAIVYALNWDMGYNYSAEITGIVNDQWSGISVEVYLISEKYEIVGTVWVECDLVEHGIARAYELAKEIVKEHSLCITK